MTVLKLELNHHLLLNNLYLLGAAQQCGKPSMPIRYFKQHECTISHCHSQERTKWRNCRLTIYVMRPQYYVRGKAGRIFVHKIKIAGILLPEKSSWQCGILSGQSKVSPLCSSLATVYRLVYIGYRQQILTESISVGHLEFTHWLTSTPWKQKKEGKKKMKG